LLEVPLAVGSRLGASVGTPLVVEESRDLGVCLGDDVAAGSTRAAQRLTPRTAAQALEGDDPGATITGANVNGYLVDEHGSSEPRSIRRRGR
jgi:hypothetical protein